MKVMDGGNSLDVTRGEVCFFRGGRPGDNVVTAALSRLQLKGQFQWY